MVMSGPVGCRDIIGSIDKEREKAVTGKVWQIRANEYFAKHLLKVSQDTYAMIVRLHRELEPPSA